MHKVTIHYGDYIITGNYIPATPDVHYLRNGDPGYPGDPSEFEPLLYRDSKGRFIKNPFYKDEPDVCDDMIYAEMCEEADAVVAREEAAYYEQYAKDLVSEDEIFSRDMTA